MEFFNTNGEIIFNKLKINLFIRIYYSLVNIRKMGSWIYLDKMRVLMKYYDWPKRTEIPLFAVVY